MKSRVTLFVSLFLLSIYLLIVPSNKAYAVDDETLSCEAILCFAGGWGYPECRRSIRHYFNIFDWRVDRMIKKRLNFLLLCPSEQPRSDLLQMARLAGTCTGDRYISYINGMVFSTYDEDNNDCSWDATGGTWGHAYGCTGRTAPLSTRINVAKKQCASYHKKYPIENIEKIKKLKTCSYNYYFDPEGGDNNSSGYYFNCVDTVVLETKAPKAQSVPKWCPYKVSSSTYRRYPKYASKCKSYEISDI